MERIPLTSHHKLVNYRRTIEHNAQQRAAFALQSSYAD